jgi:hypothetical protein
MDVMDFVPEEKDLETVYTSPKKSLKLQFRGKASERVVIKNCGDNVVYDGRCMSPAFFDELVPHLW